MVDNVKEKSSLPASNTKSVLSQMVACLALDMLLIDLGMSFSFVTIIIPAVLNAQDGLSLTETQASWLGSIGFLFQPFGSIFSGPVLDYFGRKKAILLLNVPHITAWLMLSYCWDVPTLFVANILLGIGTGLMEGPAVTYVSEISEYSMRGMMTTLANGIISSGLFLAFLMGLVLTWQKAALYAIFVPILSMVFSALIPETPIWLLAKGRKDDALKSLCKLRGWVKPEAVKDEFNDLLRYSKQLQKCIICLKTNQNTSECKHINGNMIKNKLLKLRHIMLSKETLRPFSLVIAYFFFFTMSGLQCLKPNMINICLAFGMDYDPKKIAVLVGGLYIFSSITSAFGVKWFGKRKMVLSTMLGSCLSKLSLSIYASLYLPPDVFSFDPATFTAEKSMVPVVLFLMMTCFTALGLPWVILAEVFPFRSRGTAIGVSAALVYYIFFLCSKSNYDLELVIGLSGTLAFHAGIGFIGIIYLYLYLPETDQKTLAEVEECFKGDFKVFADDWFINKFRKHKTVPNVDDDDIEKSEKFVLTKLPEETLGVNK